MKAFFVHGTVLLGAVLAFMVSPDAHAAGCKAPKDARVTVRLFDPQPRLVTTKSLKQINSKAKAHGLLKRGGLVLGFTQSKVEASMDMQFRGFDGGNVFCVNVTRIDATFGIRLHNIEMPREYARGSCQYKTVLKHEKEHVRVNRQGVRKYASVFKRELERVQKKINPLRVRNMKQGQVETKRILQKVLKSVTKRFNKEIKAQHAKIDQPGGPYDASGACRNW